MRLIQNPREPWFYILDMYTCRFPCSMQLFSSVMHPGERDVQCQTIHTRGILPLIHTRSRRDEQ